MANKTAFGAIASAVAASTLLLTAGPASAQTADDFAPSCETGVLSYPLGSPDAPALSDTAVFAGDTVQISSGAGAFDPGSSVMVSLFEGADFGSTIVEPDGSVNVSVEIPAGLAPGTYIVLLTGLRGDEARILGICVGVSQDLGGVDEEPGSGVPPVVQPPVVQPPVVQPPAVQPPAVQPPVVTPVQGGVQAPGRAPVARPSALPFTGSVELLTVVALGAGLVAAGAGTVVVARRRREAGELPA